MVPVELTNVVGGRIKINKYVQIGSGTIVMPNLEFGEGVAVGAMSFVNKNLEKWKIYAGIPVKKLRIGRKNLLNCRKVLLLVYRGI